MTVDDIIDGVVACTAASNDNLTALCMMLNFPDERLQIDAFNGLFAGDDGTAQAARQTAEVTRFQCDYFMNGVLEVVDAVSGIVMGRCDPFVPLNVDMGRSYRNMQANIAALLEDAARREMQSESDGNDTLSGV